MADMHILLGFSNSQFEKALGDYLSGRGHNVVMHSRTSKKMIREYLLNNPSCRYAILQETVGNESYKSANELAALTDQREMNIVIVLPERLRGTDYMTTLYSAGITNALFQEGRKGGASVVEIAKLLIAPRSRMEARTFYHISGKKLDSDFATVDNFSIYYEKFENTEGTYIIKYLTVCENMNPSQIAEFTKKLPKDIIDELSQYKEFHQVLEALRYFDYDIKIKKPRRVLIGVKNDLDVKVEGRGISFIRGQKEEEKGEEMSEAIDLSKMTDEEMYYYALNGTLPPKDGEESSPLSAEETEHDESDDNESNDVDNQALEDILGDLDDIDLGLGDEMSESNITAKADIKESNPAAVVEEPSSEEDDDEEEEKVSAMDSFKEKMAEKKKKAAEEKAEKAKRLAEEKAEKERVAKEKAQKEKEEKERIAKEEAEKAKELREKKLAEQKERAEQEKVRRQKEREERERLEEERRKNRGDRPMDSILEPQDEYDEDDLSMYEDILLGSGTKISAGVIVVGILLIAVFCFVAYLAMGHHITIGGLTL